MPGHLKGVFEHAHTCTNSDSSHACAKYHPDICILQYPMSIVADSECPDQTARMRRLIWDFAIRICPKTRFRMTVWDRSLLERVRDAAFFYYSSLTVSINLSLLFSDFDLLFLQRTCFRICMEMDVRNVITWSSINSKMRFVLYIYRNMRQKKRIIFAIKRHQLTYKRFCFFTTGVTLKGK